MSDVPEYRIEDPETILRLIEENAPDLRVGVVVFVDVYCELGPSWGEEVRAEDADALKTAIELAIRQAAKRRDVRALTVAQEVHPTRGESDDA